MHFNIYFLKIKIKKTLTLTTCCHGLWECKAQSWGSDWSGYEPCALLSCIGRATWDRTTHERWCSWNGVQRRQRHKRHYLWGPYHQGKSIWPIGTLPLWKSHSRCISQCPFLSLVSNPWSQTRGNHSLSLSPILNSFGTLEHSYSPLLGCTSHATFSKEVNFSRKVKEHGFALNQILCFWLQSK